MNAETLITEHLDTWTSAIKAKSSAGRGGGKKQELYGIKKLRELILELAVRGLLVPQDPKDEPASEFLKNITAEKAKLIKTGNIKKQKDLPPLSKDELDFETPDGWKWIRLQDVAEYIQRGKGPKYADTGKVRVVSQKCVQWTGLDLSAARFVSDESLAKYQPERFLRSNDLLWNSTGTGTAGRINRINDNPENALVADSHVTIVRVLNFNSSFINCYISSSSIQNRLTPTHENSLVSGTTNQVELNTNSAIKLPVPLPPLAEQQRIVAKVDELMALCDQLEQRQEDSVRTHAILVETLLGALTAASERGTFAEAWQRIAAHFDTLFTTESSIDQLKQILLQLAVMGKLVPQDPEDEPASELLNKLREEKKRLIKKKAAKDSGKMHQKAPDNPAYTIPDSWNWVRFRELIWCFRGHNPPKSEFSYEPKVGYVRFVQITDFKTDKSAVYVPKSPKNKMVYNGEIIMAAYRHIGKLSREMEGAFNVALCKILEFQPMNRDYVELLIGTDVVKGELLRASERGHIPSMHSDHLLSLLVPLPPLAEQKRIVAKVDELMALCDRLKARLQTAQITQVHLADSLVETEIH